MATTPATPTTPTPNFGFDAKDLEFIKLFPDNPALDLSIKEPIKAYKNKVYDLGKKFTTSDQAKDFKVGEKIKDGTGSHDVSVDITKYSDLEKMHANRDSSPGWSELDAQGGELLGDVNHSDRYHAETDLHQYNMGDPEDLKKVQSYLYKCRDVEHEYIWDHAVMQKYAVFTENVIANYKYSIAVINELLQRLKAISSSSGDIKLKVVKSVLKDAAQMAKYTDQLSKDLSDASTGLGIVNKEKPIHGNFAEGNPPPFPLAGESFAGGGSKSQLKSQNLKDSDSPILYIPRAHAISPPQDRQNLMDALNSFERRFPVPEEKKTQKKKRMRKNKTHKSGKKTQSKRPSKKEAKRAAVKSSKK